MILHYLKVAFRNLLAHKTQTLVSLLGLAMAFACVSLASYWNHYERTYDAFQTNADRVYRIRPISDNPSGLLGGLTPYILHLYLKDKYPEIEKACLINKQSTHLTDNDAMHYVELGSKVSVNGVFYPERVYRELFTEETMDIFEMEIVKGNKNFTSYNSRQVAISEQLAHSLCGNKSPIGQKLDIWRTYNGEESNLGFEIAGVFKTRSKHSNLQFNVISAYHNLYDNPQWGALDGHTYVMLKSGVDHEKFIQKLQKDTIVTALGSRVFVTPLTELRYTYPDEEVNVSLDDITLFTNAAILLALCALLNYLTLFVSRLRARGRDMALRTICGSSGWQTIALLLTEYLLLLVLASLLGILFVELVMRKFMELAMIEIPFSAVMISCGCLMLFSLVLSALLSTFPIFYFKRKTLRVQIEATSARIGKNYFRSIGVCVQLVIGFLFIFCTTVMTKQIYMLTHTDNIERKKVAWVAANNKQHDLLQDVLRQLPFIKKILPVVPLFPYYIDANSVTRDWDGKSADDPEFRFAYYGLNDEIAQFYGLKMKEGPASFELGRGEIFINETMAKKLNMQNPIGKTLIINFNKNRSQIKGIVSDFQVQNPRTEPLPIVYGRFRSNYGIHVAFKYEGDWETCRKKLEEQLLERGVKNISFADGEKHYDYFLKSEYNLLKLLAVITLVSILIAVFGIYAMIMQSCDQHQKEIAIRKVYGAKVSDILLMFFKQYMVQVALAAVIAFPIGYFLMKNWLEQYARQTSISLWIYLFIFLAISLLVTLCIGWRVWKAANENPAWVIKKE